jgi:ankyrin repeat protein
MAVPVHVEIHALAGEHGTRPPDPVLKLGPRLLGERVALSRLLDLPVGVELDAREVGDDDTRRQPGQIDHRIAHRERQFNGVSIRARRAEASIADLIGHECAAVWYRQDDRELTGDVLDISVSPQVTRSRHVARYPRRNVYLETGRGGDLAGPGRHDGLTARDPARAPGAVDRRDRSIVRRPRDVRFIETDSVRTDGKGLKSHGAADADCQAGLRHNRKGSHVHVGRSVTTRGRCNEEGRGQEERRGRENGRAGRIQIGRRRTHVANVRIGLAPEKRRVAPWRVTFDGGRAKLLPRVGQREEVDVEGSDPRAIAFRQAVEANDDDALRSLFAEHPDLSAVIDEPWFSFDSPALVHAAGCRSRPMIDALVDLGADLDARSKWENGPYSALHRLVDGATPESLALADHLAARGAPVDVHAASGMGRVERVRELLDAEPESVSAPGPDGATPLHLACTPQVAALLLERGADIEKRCIDHKSTPAMWAAGDREEVMRFLLDQGAKPDLYQAVLLDDTSLAAAILEDDPDAIRVRVRFGESHPHVGFGDKYVWALHGAETPVELARQRDRHRTRALLLELSPPETRLLQAARREDDTTMNAILDEDPALLSRLTEAQQCEIMYGSAIGAEVLIDRGADPNARDDQAGATALHHAAWRGLEGLAQTLLDRGADTSIRDRHHDSSPLGWANENDQSAMLELLLSRRAPDIVDAAWLGHVDRVTALLSEAPTLVDGYDNGRISPLRSAAWCGQTEVVRTLLDFGADATLVNPFAGKTALDFATERGHEAIVRLLSG